MAHQHRIQLNTKLMRLHALQIEQPTEEGDEEESAVRSLRLLPDATAQDRVFAVHANGSLPSCSVT